MSRGLGLIRNTIGPCNRCGRQHAYLTRHCRPVILPVYSWDCESEPWRWGMLFWTNWWSWVFRRPVHRLWVLRCRLIGHAWYSPEQRKPDQHRVMACRRCKMAVDLESDEVIARDGRVIALAE